MQPHSARSFAFRAAILAVIGLPVLACGLTPGGSPPPAEVSSAPLDVTGPAAAATQTGPSPIGSAQAGPAETSPAQAATAPGSYKESITSGGVLRRYILYIPAGYDGSKPLPLVFILHGHGGTGAGMEKSTGMDGKADAAGFFVAYLNGTTGSDGQQAWNTGITPYLGITADDVGFVRDLAGQLQTRLKVDPARIYAAGFSNGAMMTHRLAAELPGLLAAAAAVEGTVGTLQTDGTFVTTPTPSGPIPMLIIHGKRDGTVPYNGISRPGSDKPDMKSAVDSAAFWTQADGCSGTPKQSTGGGGNILTDDYVTCATGAEVELLTIVNGVHEWPTLEDAAHMNGTDAVWEFFSRHARPGS